MHTRRAVLRAHNQAKARQEKRTRLCLGRGMSLPQPGARLVALFDFVYVGDRPDFVSFKKDDLFVFVAPANADWWHVRTSRGDVVLAPVTYLATTTRQPGSAPPPSAPSSSSAAPSTEQVCVVHCVRVVRLTGRIPDRPKRRITTQEVRMVPRHC